MQIDFSVAFDRVSYSGLLFKIRDGLAVFNVKAVSQVIEYRGLWLIVSAVRMLGWFLAFLRVVFFVLYCFYFTRVIC